MNSASYTITTTRSKIISASVNARQVSVHAIGTGVVYLGGSDVTAANGMLTEKNAVPFTFTLPANNELWAISTGSEDLRVMLPSNMSGL